MLLRKLDEKEAARRIRYRRAKHARMKLYGDPTDDFHFDLATDFLKLAVAAFVIVAGITVFAL